MTSFYLAEAMTNGQFRVRFMLGSSFTNEPEDAHSIKGLLYGREPHKCFSVVRNLPTPWRFEWLWSDYTPCVVAEGATLPEAIQELHRRTRGMRPCTEVLVYTGVWEVLQVASLTSSINSPTSVLLQEARAYIQHLESLRKPEEQGAEALAYYRALREYEGHQ